MYTEFEKAVNIRDAGLLSWGGVDVKDVGVRAKRAKGDSAGVTALVQTPARAPNEAARWATANRADIFRPSSMPDAVHEQLRALILSGELAAGEKIRQNELAKSFGTSRVPVREALRRLESEGLVTLWPQRGYVVASLDIREIEEIFQIRIMLEERAGYVATLVRTPEDVAAVENILQKMERVSVRQGSGLNEWAAYNHEFHQRLFKSSGQLHLCRMVDMLRDTVQRYILIFVATGNHRDQAQSDHHKIVAAFRAGDAVEVGRLSREHCRHTCEGLIAALKANNTKLEQEGGET